MADISALENTLECGAKSCLQNFEMAQVLPDGEFECCVVEREDLGEDVAVCDDVNALRRVCIKEPDKQACFAVRWLDPNRRLLLEWLDQGMGQGSQSRYWLYGRGGVRGNCFKDSFHRNNNTWNNKVDNVTGLRVTTDETTYLIGFRKGPWKSCNHFQRLKLSAKAFLRNNDHNNPAFAFCYDHIVEDRYGPNKPPGAGSPEHMELIWQSLSGSPLLRRKGTGVKRTRWFYHICAGDELCHVWGEFLLFVLIGSLEMGFYKSILDTPLFKEHDTRYCGDMPDLGDLGPDDDEDSSG